MAITTATTSDDIVTRSSTLLFGGAMFVSAALVFALEPLIAKMILPLLGGAPAVWNTSMMFFQIALLAGYSYAHALRRLLPLRAQIVCHMGFLGGSALILPVGVSGIFGSPPVENPVWWLLGTLAVSAGPPFVALSATAPLLQSWYARLWPANVAAKNPYVLYGASNLGSVLALISYPLLIEPSLGLSKQSYEWSILYLLFSVQLIAIGICVWRNASAPTEIAASFSRTAWSTRLKWILLAAAPSSLMLGTTSYIAEDIASVPLFWVIPLTLYLLTFIISFQDRPFISAATALRWQLVFAAMAAGLLQFPATGLALHLIGFLGALFFGALVCHQALVASRPHHDNLTEFYLLISLGGVLGGVFNALLAPMLFDDVLEFPLMLVLICLARPWKHMAIARRDVFLLAMTAIIAVSIGLFSSARVADAPFIVVVTLVIVGGFAAAMAGRRHAGLLALGIGILCSQATLTASGADTILWRDRSFFGVSRVETADDPQIGKVHVLYHGTTVHGAQALAPERRCIPGTYYAPESAMGEIITRLQKHNRALRIGVVGLGAGAISAYTRPADRLRYFEIDPAVAQIARNPKYFSFLSECAKGRVEIVLGDARLTLAREPAGKFDLLILDAFSSDNIPTHLMTRQAFALYLRALKPDGVALLHITNRNLELEEPAAATARLAGASARVKDFIPPDGGEGLKAAHSKVLLMSRAPAVTASTAQGAGWRPAFSGKARPWTDEYTNIAGALLEHALRPSR